MTSAGGVLARSSSALKPLDPDLRPEVKEWAEQLRKAWTATGLSLGQFTIKHPGTNPGTVSRYLSGERIPADHWFLDNVLSELAAIGKAVSPGESDRLARLHLAALETAHPREYRVLQARDELKVAVDAKQAAEQRVHDLEEQLADRARELLELATDAERQRSAWQTQLDQLTRQIEEITGQLGSARHQLSEAERRCRELEDLLRRLEFPGPLTALQPVPAQLPRDIADFTGREAEAHELRGLLEPQPGQGAMPITLVAGPGAGKTTLAVHVAHQVRHMFPSGQLYVDLLGTTQDPLVPADVLGRFLRDLGVDPTDIPQDVAERAAHYRTRLAGQKILVVLDNARDASQVQPLIPGGESCAVVITTRCRMPDLAGARHLFVGALRDQEALDLFAKVVGDERRTASEPEATSEVVAACAGLPLAVRICGSRLASHNNWTIATLASRLRDETRRLNELTCGNLSVRGSFEAGLAIIPTPAHAIEPAGAVRLLGLWNGPTISAPAAAALFGSHENAAISVLELLAEANLLTSLSPGRYRLHDLGRLYAAERAMVDLTDDERSAAIARILHWYLRCTDAAATAASPYRYTIRLHDRGDGESTLAFTGSMNALAWYDEEYVNVLAAIRQAASAGLHDIAWRLAVSAFWLFDSRDNWSDCTATHLIALDSALRTSDRQGEAWVLNNLGVASGWTGNPDAVEYLERSREIRREIGDRLGEAQSASNLARLYQQTGRGEEAVSMLYQTLKLTREAGHRYGEAVVLSNLGDVLLGLNRPAEAIGRARHALDIFAGLNSQEGTGCSLHCIGRCFMLMGRYREAAEAFTDAFARYQACGNLNRQALTLRFLGRAQARNGQPEQARETWAHSAAIYERLGDMVEATQVRCELTDPTDRQNSAPGKS